MNRIVHTALGSVLAPRERTERGLSQSTENAILLAAALTIAGAIAVAVGIFVKNKMAGFG